MDIVIIADFCGTFDGTDNNRFAYLANMLRDNNNVEIITSDFNHGKKTYFEKIAKKFSYKLTMLHEPFYPTNVCLRRFYSHYIWGRNVAKYLNQRERPDVIYCAVPTLKAANEAAKYCEKNDIRFIIDIQDLWPEAFQMVFNFPVLSSFIFYPMKRQSEKIYSMADEIIAVSNIYCQRAMEVNTKCKVAHPVYIGTPASSFDKFISGQTKYVKDDNATWIAYCGTLGSSYDITCVIDALAILKNRGYGNITFIVMGDGPLELQFKKYANNAKITTVFTGRIPYGDMVSLLCKCDLTVNPIVKNSVATIINKHADYAACGLPVVNTQESSEYRSFVKNYEMGFNCKNGDPDDLAEKIEILINDIQLRKRMGENARKAYEKMFNREKTYNEIVNVILNK